MIKKLRSLSEVLPDLLVGILLYGAVCEAILLIFAKEKLYYSIGLLIGLLCAMAMAIHMAWSLNMALDLGEEGAVSKMKMHNLIRYSVLIVIFGLLMVFRVGNPLVAFLGVMGLKVAAYLQPITHKIFRR